MNAVSTPENAAVAAAAPAEEGRASEQHIAWLRRWTPNLISFRVTRPADYRFTPGHYARLGIRDIVGTVEWRPFSMVSPVSEDYLEFVAGFVPGGEFSHRLAHLHAGDAILVDKRSFGFLTVDQLAPGADLWLLASGTGIGPFMSILADPSTWARFDRLTLVHSVRHADELVYRDDIELLAVRMSRHDAGKRFAYVPVVTREQTPDALHARIPQLLEQGILQERVGRTLDVAHSRVMACGNPELTRDIRAMLAARGFQPGRRGVPGQMAFEKYW